MLKRNVLLDLSLAHRKYGHAGIPQDARFLFDGLCGSTRVEPSGLLWSSTGIWHGASPATIADQAVFLGTHLEAARPSLLSKLTSSLSPALGTISERLLFAQLRRIYDLQPVRSRQHKEVIWRQLFSGTLEARSRGRIEERPFYLSGLGMQALSDAATYNLPAVRLDTRGFDFVVFQDSRKVRVSPGTKKIIRYHDGIPVLHSDTGPHAGTIKLHAKAAQFCARDSIYVCNSPSAVADLSEIAPRAAERALVIPYFVPPMARVTPTRERLEEIAALRLSSAAMPTSGSKAASRTAAERVATWFGKGDAIPPYLLTLSTIEPRKNVRGLVEAWSRLRAARPDLKLVVIGRPGWEFADSLAAMGPYVERGDLLHLERVPQDEIPHWYTAAACFVFPSFAEGFGLPPVEAMQCGCPVALSDIRAHRFAAGDAGVFFDPYDVGAIADGIAQALEPAVASELRARGRANAERFTVEAVLPLWEDLFDRHAPAR
jgi:glycosyltransferase involved in cell wall biosynthesis